MTHTKVAYLIASILFIALILVPNVYASTYDFKFGESVNIKNPCFNNGTYCGPTATCNITVYRPIDNEVIVDNLGMTNQISYFNYTLEGLIPIGTYKCDQVCDDDGLYGSETFYVTVSPTGDTRGYGIFLILAFGTFIMLCLSLYTKNEWLGIIAGMMFIVLGVYTFSNGIGAWNDMYTQAISVISIGLGIIFFVAAIFEAAWGGGEE